MKRRRSADWRIERLAKIRKLIKQAEPKVIEKQQYRKASNPGGIPVWYHEGMICTGETYTEHLRLTFAKGNRIKDPKKLFNAFRAIVIKEGDKLNEKAFKDVVKAAAALNLKAKEDQKIAAKKKQSKK